MTRSGEDEPELGPLPPRARERLVQPGVVLVRPRVRRVEQEGLARFVAGRQALVVDAEGNRDDTRRVDPVPEEERLARVLRDGDHDSARRDRLLVEDAPVGELGPREELRVELVLQVVDGHRRRRPVARRREGHGEREVDRVERVEPHRSTKPTRSGPGA